MELVRQGISAVEIYDPLTNSWEEEEVLMEEYREEHAAAAQPMTEPSNTMRRARRRVAYSPLACIAGCGDVSAAKKLESA